MYCSSLSQDEIPIKLRCAICSRLAINAFRLPCCEQAICESCEYPGDLYLLISNNEVGQSTLPSSCPVCEHTPVAAEDCKPNKSLRTTIKVFLRTEEKKREALRLKEEKNTPPDTPVLPEPTPVEQAPVIEETPIEQPVSAEVKTEAEPSTGPVDETLPNAEQVTQAEQDIPQQSIEVSCPFPGIKHCI
jgi:hypothetical protein